MKRRQACRLPRCLRKYPGDVCVTRMLIFSSDVASAGNIRFSTGPSVKNHQCDSVVSMSPVCGFIDTAVKNSEYVVLVRYWSLYGRRIQTAVDTTSNLPITHTSALMASYVNQCAIAASCQTEQSDGRPVLFRRCPTVYTGSCLGVVQLSTFCLV